MLAKVSRSQSSHFEQIGRFKVWKTSNKRLRAGATLRTTAGDLLALEVRAPREYIVWLISFQSGC